MKKRVLAALVLLGLLSGCGAPAEELDEARFLFVGTEEDAACTVLLSGEDCVVIDTGEAVDGPHMVSLLEENGVEAVDYLLLTHPDKDHVGGVPCLLEALPVGEILVPRYGWEEEKAPYVQALETAEELGVPVTELTAQRQLTCGEIDLTVWPPREAHYDKSNNYSLAIRADHGEVNLFLAGDAQKKRVKELMLLPLPEEVELYQVAHHGRESKIGAELIRRLSPEWAVVNAAAPEDNIRQALEAVDAEICSTLGRDVSFRSDGRTLTEESITPLP